MIRSLLAILLLVLPGLAQQPVEEPRLIRIMGEELDYCMKNLALPDGTKPYYLEYTITDVKQTSLRAELGALHRDSGSHQRALDVVIRVGSHELDNTHQIRGRGGFGRGGFRLGGGASIVPVEDDPMAIKHALWKQTDRTFKSAARRYQQVLTNLKTMVDEDDDSDDFSREKPSRHFEPEVGLAIDREEWAGRLRAASELARKHPLILGSSVTLSASAENRYMVSSEKTRLVTARKLLRVIVTASTRAEDGMELSQSKILDAARESDLPGQDEIAAALGDVIGQVLALREAPLVEPTTCPAILRNRASGVFFHEIFGHRIEGHRQKDVEEGQTFTKKVGKPVLPEFLSVTDDPTLQKFGDVDLRGFYRFDDEGVKSSPVRLIEGGVLKTFLLSRSPVDGFPRSNGHGRRQPGRPTVARQGNLVVSSSRTVGFDELRRRLVEECKKQGKPSGLLFEDITGGFTTTRRRGAQSFKVLPVVVYRVFADGRPDQLVRGVDIVGTPLSCFSKIICTADDPAVFNGTCGAESGNVPVSAISPSILVSQIEIEKRAREQGRPPILPSPLAETEN